MLKFSGLQTKVANGHAAEALPCVHMSTQLNRQIEVKQRLEMGQSAQLLHLSCDNSLQTQITQDQQCTAAPIVWSC